MGVNVVIFGDSTVVDLREDTVKPETLNLGETAHGKDGNKIEGTFTIEEELTTQDGLIEDIMVALAGKAAGSGGSGGADPVIRALSVTQNGTYTAPAGVDGYSPIVVDVPIPDVPNSVEQATPTITVSSSGLITAKATQEAGLVSAGTKSATKQLTTKGATTITPGTSEQIAVSAGTFVTGDIKVAAVSGSDDVEAISVAFASNWFIWDGNSNVPTSFVIFFRPGWTWADYIASEFNKCPEILDGVLTGNKGAVQAVKANSRGGLISALPNASGWMLLKDYDTYEQASAADLIEANKIYYIG